MIEFLLLMIIYFQFGYKAGLMATAGLVAMAWCVDHDRQKREDAQLRLRHKVYSE